MPDSKNSTSPLSAQPVVEIPLMDIQTPDARAARLDPDPQQIEALAENMQACGLINPIVVTGEDGAYQLVAGGRRCAAAALLGWATIPARIRSAEHGPQYLVSLSENLLRSNMTPLEEAHTLRSWIDGSGQVLESIAAALGRTTAWVKSRLELLEMPPDVQDAVHHADIPIGAAAPIADIDDDAHRTHLLTSARQHGVTVSVAKSWRSTYAALKTNCPGPLPPPTAIAHYADPPRPTQLCFCCGDRDDMRNLTLVPMHPACFSSLSDAVHRSTAEPPEGTRPP